MTAKHLLSGTVGAVFCAAVLIAAPRPPVQEKQENAPRKSAAVSAVEKIRPAVVFLQGTAKTDKGKEGKRTRVGVGILIDPGGTIVANHSIIQKLNPIEVVLGDGRKLPAKAVFSDPDLDLAVVKVEAPKPLPHAEVGDIAKVEAGDLVLALNSPWTVTVDEPPTVVAGIIAGITPGTKKGEKLFVVDTAIGPGCGPGPLISREGKLLGLVVGSGLGPRGTNSAIPSNRVTERVADWARKK
jgi:serine protease Do